MTDRPRSHTPASLQPMPDPDEAGPIRWLHLSDLHVGCRGEALWWQMIEQFWRRLDEQVEVVGAPDLVLMTGDLTFKGDVREFDALTSFLEQLRARLPKGAQGQPPPIVPVPGNHDLQRPTGREARQFRVLLDYEKGRADQDVADLIDELWVKQDPSFVRPLFANYLAWFDQVIRVQERAGVTLRSSFFPGDVYVKIELPGRFPLTIVGLNSAWIHHREGDFESKLVLPLEQFQAVLPRAPGASPLAVLGETHRALLMMHHPRSWLSRAQQQIFDSGIYAPERFDACLHGHMHLPNSENTSRAGGAPRCYYQAPSLFGVEHYGRSTASRAIGFTWGALHEDGELRVWPQKWAPKGDGAEVFDRDDFFHWDPAGGVLLRRGDGRRLARPHTQQRGAGSRVSELGLGRRIEIAEPAAIVAYRTWLLEQKPGVKLIGVGGGDMSLDLDAVYVPLRARERLCGDLHGVGAAQSAARRRRAADPANVGEASEPLDFEVDRLFEAIQTPHALILGEPGSGKTTALHKLLHVCAREGAEALGLPEGTVPVPLWMRRFTSARDNRPISAWIQDELDERSGRKLPAELGAALWAHGRLILLADGLDEVADEGLRARLCGYLWEQVEGTRVRAVVSSRYAGYRRAVKLPAQFTELELRPLSGEMVDRLVRQWFAEAVRVVRTVSEEEAQARGRELIAALHSEVYTTQRLKVMVSTPLLLTLLCVIVHQGRPMPRSRAEYYERCLEVLLLRWGKEQKRREPPLVIDKALAVLRPLAYALQASGDRDTRLRAELAVMVKKRLRELGLDDRLGMQVVDWLQRDAGVLQEFAPEHLGFAHLGLQEYLAATHIGERDTLLDELTAHLADPWWHEVARLVAGQRVAFVPLMRRVLKVQISQGELLDQLLDEAPEADATPLLERLHAGGTPRELATVLRLLRRFSGDERVREAVAERSGDKDAEVQALAAQILEVRESGGMREGAEVVLVFFEKERTAAEGLAKQLRACGVQVFSDAQGRLFDALELNSELEAAEAAPCVVVLSGRQGPAWDDAAVSSCVAYFVDAKKAMAWALLPGGMDAAWPAELGEARRFDVRDPGGCDALRGWLATARRGARRIESGQHFIEQVTGIRFLWVPGGRFEMGMKGVEEPVHRVRLSPYWLAETPVTNAQYGKFLAATGHNEPAFWRDRRFSHEEQPVAGVSWEDAMQFCAWLSEQPEVIASGVKVTLPSEAQWEFAARGTDGRRYPWGNEPADATRAVYGRKDGTAKVGSCPAGRGPFGHLDLAGNVWQWCRDGFKPDEYRSRGRLESIDPVGQSGGSDRALRGSPWGVGSVQAAAARSSRRSYRTRDGYGFRVAAEPQSYSS